MTDKSNDGDRVSIKKFLIEGIVAGVIGGIIVSIVTAALAPTIASRVSLLEPTCDDPGVLQRVPISPSQIDGNSYRSESKYSVAKVVDGLPGSVWMPPAKENDGTGSRGDVVVSDSEGSLRIDFGDRARDVRMLCVVNGIANEVGIYRNHLKARHVEILTDNGTQAATLRALDDGSFQNFQTVPVRTGRTNFVEIKVVDFQVGQFVTTKNPRLCSDNLVDTRETVEWLVDRSGCIMDPQPLGGIAEIEVYGWDATRWEKARTLLIGG